MSKNLFFVDSIYSLVEENFADVILLSAEEEQSLVLRLESERLKMYNHRGPLREGWYVYYDEGKQVPFGYGNLSSYARERFREYYALRNQLTRRIVDHNSEVAAVPQVFLTQQAQITSYHVNVGHGSCSIVLLEVDGSYQLWMVDSSVIDKTDHWRNYQINLEETFKHIARKLGKQENEPLLINKFFLTHAHHDHYSGIEYLVNNHYIDNRTLCYINLYYQMASKAYIRALTALKNANAKFVEPVVGNSINGIRFLHPECRLYRSKATVKNARGNYRIVTSPVNDSSTVVLFSLGGHSMVFTGDLEQKGFKNMSRACTCSAFLFDADYYIVSHHGSFNGHPDIPCMNPRRPIPTPLLCASHNLNKAIMMGRNGAYSGIYSHVVTSYWNRNPGRLVLTENAPHFAELEWGTGTVRYI